jgi:hypothetical protein
MQANSDYTVNNAPLTYMISPKHDPFTKRSINMVNDIRILPVPVVGAEGAGEVVAAHRPAEATPFVPV